MRITWWQYWEIVVVSLIMYCFEATILFYNDNLVISASHAAFLSVFIIATALYVVLGP